MTFILFRKILFLIILVMISGCNYKPLFNKDQQKSFAVKSFEVEGDKRVAQILINKMGIIRDKSGKFNIIIFAFWKIATAQKFSIFRFSNY